MLALAGIPGLGTGELMIVGCMCAPVVLVVVLIVLLLNRSKSQPTSQIPPAYPPAPTQAPAGWYPDPLAPGQMRYWDGLVWTQQVRPRDSE